MNNFYNYLVHAKSKSGNKVKYKMIGEDELKVKNIFNQMFKNLDVTKVEKL